MSACLARCIKVFVACLWLEDSSISSAMTTNFLKLESLSKPTESCSGIYRPYLALVLAGSDSSNRVYVGIGLIVRDDG